LLKTFLLLPLVGVVIMATNVFRAVALFYIEGGILRAPSWGHEYAGVIAFVLEAAGIIAIVMRLRRRNVCVVTTSAT
jgi:exosortase/archaeosortase family protein